MQIAAADAAQVIFHARPIRRGQRRVGKLREVEARRGSKIRAAPYPRERAGERNARNGNIEVHGLHNAVAFGKRRAQTIRKSNSER